MTKYILIILSVVLGLVSSCSETQNLSPEAKESFYRIYHSKQAQDDAEATSITNWNDTVFVITTALRNTQSSFQTAGLYAISAEGLPLWETVLPEKYAAVAPTLIANGDFLYGVAMNPVSLGTYIFSIDPKTGAISEKNYFASLYYPMAIGNSPDGDVIISTYNRLSRSSEVVKVSISDFSIQWSQEYPVYEDIDEKINEYFTGKRDASFFVKQSSDSTEIRVNTAYNFSSAVLFLDVTNGNLKGSLSGYRFDQYVTDLNETPEGTFQISAIQEDRSLIAIDSNFSTSTNQQLSNLNLETMYRVNPESKISFATTNEDFSWLFTSTLSGEILVQKYSNRGALLGITTIKKSDALFFKNLCKTTDGGVLVLSKLYVLGRYRGFSVLKLSSKDLERLFE